MAHSSPTSPGFIVSRQVENLLKIKALTIDVRGKGENHQSSPFPVTEEHR